MKKGDLALYYHSNEGLEVVGIAKVIKEAYQDPTTDDPNWVSVDFKPHKKLKAGNAASHQGRAPVKEH